MLLLCCGEGFERGKGLGVHEAPTVGCGLDRSSTSVQSIRRRATGRRHTTTNRSKTRRADHHLGKHERLARALLQVLCQRLGGVVRVGVHNDRPRRAASAAAVVRRRGGHLLLAALARGLAVAWCA